LPRSAHTRRRFLAGLAAASAGLGLTRRVRGSDGLDVVVRPDLPRQTIDNFSASDCWSMDPIGREWSDEGRERIADLLFSTEKGIGLSLWRFNIGAGSSATDGDKLWDPWRGVECFRDSAEAPYDWSRQAGQQWFLRAARDRGVREFLAGANSPPVWLTANGHAYCDPTGPSTNLRAGVERDFARFLADVVEHLRRRGYAFRYLSPLNEPNWGWEGGQEGCRFANADIIRLVEALHAELSHRGLNVDILVPESGDYTSLLDDERFRAWLGTDDPATVYMSGNNTRGDGKYREYIRDLLSDARLRAMLGNRLSAHSYWTDRGRQNLVDLRRAVRANLDAYSPGASLWQTEYCIMDHKRDLSMDMALHVARVIHHDLVDAEVSAWHWWLAVSPADYKDGLIYTDYRQTGEQNVLCSKTLWVLGNWSRYVRPGYRRVTVDMAPAIDDVLPSAFTSPDGRRLVLVIVNASPRDVTLRLRVGHTTPPMRRVVTDDTHDLAADPGPSSPGELRIGTRSVVTLLGDLA